MKKTHIVISANQAWNIYNFRKGLVARFLSSGFIVSILAPKDNCSEYLRTMGCTVIDLPMAAKGINPISDLLLFYNYFRSYRSLKPDLAINYTIKPNIYGSLAARLASTPSLAITTGLGYTFLNSNIVAKIAKNLYKFAFKFPLQIWFLNTDDQREFLRYGLIDSNKAFVLDGEGIDLDCFLPREKIVEDGHFRFLLIARMLWDKGIAEYVEAAKLLKEKYPNAIFSLLGATGVDNPSAVSGEQMNEWHDQGWVTYLGTTSDVATVIANADCVVLPSYREGVPRTLMEAAAMAKPLIASDVPGCREVVIDGKNGFLCQVKSAKDLAQKMETMLNLPTEKRLALGAFSRRYMNDRFDEKKIIACYYNFLKTVEK